MPFGANPVARSGHPASESLFGKAEMEGSDFILAHIDGGARGNPGPAGYGVHVQNAKGETLAKLSGFLGIRTNNYAEYSGLLAALEYALDNHHKALKIISDSELLVKQIRGEYKVKHAELKNLYDQARQLIGKLQRFSITHALRSQNKIADQLANDAMDKGMGKPPQPTSTADAGTAKEMTGVVKNGTIELLNGTLPEGTVVQVRVKK